MLNVSVHAVVDRLPVFSGLGAVGFLAVGIPLSEGEWGLVEDVLHSVVANGHWKLRTCLIFPGIEASGASDIIALSVAVDHLRSFKSGVEQLPYGIIIIFCKFDQGLA